MSNLSEEKTKGLVSKKLGEIQGYPSEQNIEINGIIWFKEDSYKGSTCDWLRDTFATASKKQTLQDKGTPDFTVVKSDSDIIIVIECKGDLEKHSMLSDVNEYKTYGFGTSDETLHYAINGALWYASFLCSNYDVIAIGVSGQNEYECKITSFVWPKGGNIADIELLEDGNINDTMVSINQYQKDINVVLGRTLPTEEAIKKELRRYTLSCANFLRSNGIEDNSKAGFVSAIILGLTNRESKLYQDTKAAFDAKKASKSKKLQTDPLGKNAVKMLKAALYGDGNEYENDYIRGIWDIDEIPQGKRVALKKFYDQLLSKDELSRMPKGERDKDFPDGNTVLSRCIYSLYEHVIEVIEQYEGIDVMGEFYTTFLRFTKGNAKEKGIVLTPKHITELFCDIAEYYSEQKFDENTKIIDICCGTGAFLLAALNKIKENISKLKISETEKKEKYRKAQKNCLIGVERDPSMYALAYANMRFHGDGKANLFNCSSLLIDSYAPVDDSGQTYFTGDEKIPLHEILKSFGDIDVAMINPPYSLDKKENYSSDREYPIITKKKKLEEKLKTLNKELKKAQKEFQEEKQAQISSEICNVTKDLNNVNKELNETKMEEVVISKGQDELDFIAAMLHYLKVGGIGIAIVPMSCAGNNRANIKMREKILEYHTLLACMTMPQQLFFDSHVGTATCIMVFKAHVKHDENKSVFFARWQNDGFKVIPHNGRKDSGSWGKIKQEWLAQVDGTAIPDDYMWLRRKIKRGDEALAEAYIETDYTKLSDDDFENVLKKYSLFKYMDSNGLMGE